MGEQVAAWLDGRPARTADLAAVINLAMINYGHFTTVRVDDGLVRGLDLHHDRLRTDARRLFGGELDLDQLDAELRRVINASNGSYLLRVTLFDPTADLSDFDRVPSILITRRPAPLLPAAPIRVRTTSSSRAPASVKHTGLFPALWQRRQAQSDGYDDALLLNTDRTLGEGPTWTLGLIIDDRLVWPIGEVLPGVTMQLLDRVTESDRRPVPLSELGRVQAAFAASSGFGLRAITTIDEHRFPDHHPLVSQLRAGYLATPGQPV